MVPPNCNGLWSGKEPMRHSLRWALVLFVLPMALPALAQTPTFIGTHRDWTVYEVSDSRGKVCYIASEPVDQEGNYSRRGNPAALVARLPGSPPSEQVSVQPGYAYREDSAVDVKIEGRDFELFTKGEHAWALTDADDQALIDAMKRGVRMTVRGTSTRGTYSLDTYSLNGFTAAYDAMRGACAG
jgi:Invasion associated locus B (IalB) protein